MQQLRNREDIQNQSPHPSSRPVPSVSSQIVEQTQNN